MKARSVVFDAFVCDKGRTSHGHLPHLLWKACWHGRTPSSSFTLKSSRHTAHVCCRGNTKTHRARDTEPYTQTGYRYTHDIQGCAQILRNEDLQKQKKRTTQREKRGTETSGGIKVMQGKTNTSEDKKHSSVRTLNINTSCVSLPHEDSASSGPLSG